METPPPHTLTRRRLIAAGATATAALSAGPAAALAHGPRNANRHGFDHRPHGPRSSGWPMPAHDVFATRSGDRLRGTTERWRADFPGGVPATAAIAGATVFAASGSGEVAALSLADGTKLWDRQLGTAQYGSGDDARALGFFGGVAVAGRTVIVASDRARGLDVTTGATRWEAAPLRTDTSDDYFWGLPVVVGPIVLIGSGSGAELPTARGKLTAYAIADGRVVWSTATVPDGANGGGIVGPCSVDVRAGVVYIATGSPYEAVAASNPGTCSLIALRLRDGAVIWSDQVYPGDTHGFDFNSAPVIVGKRLFATNKDGIYAWDRVRRTRLWHQRVTDPLAGGLTGAGPTGGPEGGPIATDGRAIYTVSNDIDSGGAVVAALDPGDGHVLWSTPVLAPSFGAPALAGRGLCVAGADGSVRILDARTGKSVATVALGDAISAAPALAGGSFVVGTGAAPFLPGESLVCVGPSDLSGYGPAPS